MKTHSIIAGSGNITALQVVTLEDVLNSDPAKAGYHHKIENQPFHPFYEACLPPDQEAYEIGRLMAVIFGRGAYYVTLSRELAVTGQAIHRMALAIEAGDVRTPKVHP